MASRVLVTARDRRGRSLLLPALRATYDQATAADPQRPPLFLEPALRGLPMGGEAAEASLALSIRRSPSAFAALLRGLLEVSRKHRHVEIAIQGAPASLFGRQALQIYRGAFDGPAKTIHSWLDGFENRSARPSLAETPPPAPGAERMGQLEPLVELLRGTTWALAYSGAVYLPDGPETARRITPPGRFSPTCWAPDRKALAVLGRAEGGELSLWISHNGSGVQAAFSLDGPGDPTNAAFSPDGSNIAVTTSNGRLAVLPAHGGSVASILVGKNLKLFDPAWSPDGDLVACVTEDASRARTLHVVSVAEGKKGARLLGVDAPATEDQALADPEFSEDGSCIYVRALWGAKGEPRHPTLLRVPLAKTGKPEPVPVGPRLSRVQLRGGISRWRAGKLFLAGIGDTEERLADAAWLDAAALEPGAITPALVAAPPGAKLAFGIPDLSIVFAKRTVASTRIWRGDKKVKLPFPAWLCLA